MATFKGSDGVVMIGANQLGEVKSYSVDETFDYLIKHMNCWNKQK